MICNISATTFNILLHVNKVCNLGPQRCSATSRSQCSLAWHGPWEEFLETTLPFCPPSSPSRQLPSHSLSSLPPPLSPHAPSAHREPSALSAPSFHAPCLRTSSTPTRALSQRCSAALPRMGSEVSCRLQQRYCHHLNPCRSPRITLHTSSMLWAPALCERLRSTHTKLT